MSPQNRRGEELTIEMVRSAFAAYEKHLRQQALREVRDAILKVEPDARIMILAWFDEGGRFEVKDAQEKAARRAAERDEIRREVLREVRDALNEMAEDFRKQEIEAHSVHGTSEILRPIIGRLFDEGGRFEVRDA